MTLPFLSKFGQKNRSRWLKTPCRPRLRPAVETLEGRDVPALPTGWVLDAGGAADMVRVGTGSTGTEIHPTEGEYMLWLGSAGTTPTGGFTNDLGEAGSAGTVVRGPATRLTAGAAVALDYYVSTPDAAPFNDFALGLVSGAGELFSFTQTASTLQETGWRTATLTVPADGDYQLTLVASDERDRSLDTDLYVDNVRGFYLPDTDGTFVPLPTVSFDLAASDLTASEAVAADDTATFVVTRVGDLSQPLTVYYTAYAGWPYGAAAGADYAALPGTVTFGAGEGTAQIVISPVDDDLGERDETVQVYLESPYDENFERHYDLTYPAFAEAVIADDDGGVATVTLTAPAEGVVEGSGGSARFTLTRTGGNTAAPLTVSYDVYDGWGTFAGVDYAALPGSVTFEAGGTTAVIDITPIDDAEFEAAETVYLSLRTDTDGSYAFDWWTGSGSATIVDDDGPPGVAIAATDDTATEDGDTATFTVRLTAGPLDADLTVSYTVNPWGSDGATAGEDYEPLAGTVTIPAGATTATITLTAIDDEAGEAAEGVTVLLTDPGDGSYLPDWQAGSSAVATIAESDGGPTVVEFVSPAADTSEGGTGAVFTLTRAGGNTAAPLTVGYNVYGGSATAGVDYEPPAGTVTFTAGETTASFTITPIQDTVGEFDEQVYLALNYDDPNFEVGYSGAALATITDDDGGPVVVSIDPTFVSVAEGDALTFTVTRTGDRSAALDVPLVTYPWDSAQLGVDYTLSETDGVVTIPAGAASATFTLTAADDADEEFFENATVQLAAGAGYELGWQYYAYVSIPANDGPPVVGIAATDPTASEPGLGADTATFTLTRTGGDLAAPLTVTYFTGWYDGAVPGEDYDALPLSVTFAPGEATATITVTALADDLGEYDENVTIQLEAPADRSYDLDYSNSVAWVTIQDDDGGVPVITWAPGALSVVEGSGTPATVVLTRTGGKIDQPLTVSYYTGLYGEGTARRGVDYQDLPFEVTFAAGETTATIEVVPTDDAVGEADEDVVLALGNDFFNPMVFTILDDDGGQATVAMTVTDPRAMEASGDEATYTLTRTGGNPDAPLTVEFYYSSGSAEDGVDFVSLTETLGHRLTFAAGQATATIDVVPLADGVAEPDETVSLWLPDASLGGDYRVDPARSFGTVVIADGAPPAVTALGGPAGGVRGEELAFSAAFTDPDAGSTHTVTWDFGDGTVLRDLPATAPGALTPTHAYTAVGTYTVTVRVVDDQGGVGSATRTVTVTAVRLGTDPLDPTKTALFVGGTPGNDAISFSPAGGASGSS
ncbi:MAG: PKD domain-containing protein [Gemmataceae bacterium]|nr:PKD domain-containing protein [Gemmataceae bacterium]